MAKNTPPGPAVDASGQTVIDPTANVRADIAAAVKRQDDLRDAESRHVREVAALRAEYTSELRRAESERIDAIRAVDVGAVNRASEVSATQAATLANQVAQSAEALRGQVEQARVQTAAALSAALEPIIRDIADLRKSQYEAQGQKTQVIETRAGAGQSWVVVAGIVGLLSLLGLAASVGLAVYALNR